MADPTKPPRKYIFESPLVRLGSDFGYSDVFTDGHDIMDDDWTGGLPRACIIIYRYYDPASTLLGTGETPPIQTFAQGLSKLIARVRDLVCQDPDNHLTKETFSASCDSTSTTRAAISSGTRSPWRSSCHSSVTPLSR